MATDEGSAFLTPESAREKGLDFPEPPEYACPHCGRKLEPRGVALNGRIAWISHEPCGCEGELRAAEAEKAAEAASRLRDEQVRRVNLLREAGITRRYENAEVFDPRCAQYLRDFGGCTGDGLYIFGEVGTGKTTLANALAREFAFAGYKVILTTTIGMLEKIQDTYGKEASSLLACHGYGECDVLVLDDFGKESASAWSVMTIFQIVNMRYESMLPTIVTSQYSPYELCRRLGRCGEKESAAAIVSRLRGTMEVVRLTGPDKRVR